MTREEAIKELKVSLDTLREYDIDNSSRLKQALDMAIKALNSLEEVYFKGYNDGFTQAEVNHENDKALSQEPCDDAISRSGAIKAIEERAKRIKNEDTLNGLAGAVGILFELPPVNPTSNVSIQITEREKYGRFN